MNNTPTARGISKLYQMTNWYTYSMKLSQDPSTKPVFTVDVFIRHDDKLLMLKRSMFLRTNPGFFTTTAPGIMQSW